MRSLDTRSMRDFRRRDSGKGVNRHEGTETALAADGVNE